MKVLITGGAGFIGSNYVKHVLGGNLSGISRVTVLDKLTYAGTLTNLASLPSDDFEFVEGDICDEALVNELMTRQDAVVNFAAESHVDRSISGSKDFVLTNVLGTHTLLEAARRRGDITFVQVSTDEVYGSVASNSKDQPSRHDINITYCSACQTRSGRRCAKSGSAWHRPPPRAVPHPP